MENRSISVETFPDQIVEYMISAKYFFPQHGQLMDVFLNLVKLCSFLGKRFS